MISPVPRLKNLLIRRIWRGCYPMTPDGIPIIDRAPGVEGMVLYLPARGSPPLLPRF
jgi:sarcosine oxidase subunit beta